MRSPSDGYGRQPRARPARRQLRLVLLLAPLLVAGSALAADDDPLSAYRERFRAGMERYKSGNMSEAIQYWEPIYREIGPSKGYRLSFDLARAYESYGESTRAAERYESFLAELGSRRDAHEELEPIVLREEEEARKRLEEMQASKGRIRVVPGTRPLLAQVDLAEPRLGAYVTYVAPGSHVVTFAPGSTEAEKHTVDVKAGAVVDVAPNPTAPGPPPAPAERPVPPLVPAAARAKLRPFSAVWIYAAGGATLVGVLVPVATYGNARSLLANYNATGAGAGTYYSQKTTAYASLAVPIGLAAATAALVTWYFAGTKEVDMTTTLSAGIAPGRDGASAVVQGTF